MWDLAPRQRKPLKTAHESAEGGVVVVVVVLNVWFEKFVGVPYMVLQLGVESQTTPIDVGGGMNFFQIKNDDHIDWNERLINIIYIRNNRRRIRQFSKIC
jgi:hypothetical protein